MSVSQILATKDCGLVLKDLKPYWSYLEFHQVLSSFFLVCFQTTLLCVDKACCGDDMFCILWTDKCQLSPTVRERGFAGMGVGCATLFCWHVFPSAYPHD